MTREGPRSETAARGEAAKPGRKGAGRTPRVPAVSRHSTEALQSIRRLVEHLQESARAVEKRTGLTNAQLFLLRAFEHQPVLSLGELAAAAGAQQSTTSLVVQILVRDGLVRRRPSAEDGRRVELSVTAKGREKLRDAPEPPTGRLLLALEQLSASEMGALVRGLGALERQLGAAGVEPAMLFEK